MRSYLSLIPISAKARRRQNRMTLLCIIFAVFLVTGIFSMADMAIATSPNGGGMHIQMENSTLEALGIAGLDVTSKDFSLDSIDKALDMVSERRSSLGASTNALQYTRNLNNSAAINQLSARSRLEDLDFPKAIAKKKQDEVFGQYRIAMLRRQMDEKRKSTMAFF